MPDQIVKAWMQLDLSKKLYFLAEVASANWHSAWGQS